MGSQLQREQGRIIAFSRTLRSSSRATASPSTSSPRVHRDRHVRLGALPDQTVIKSKIPRRASPTRRDREGRHLARRGRRYVTGEEININGGAFMQ